MNEPRPVEHTAYREFAPAARHASHVLNYWQVTVGAGYPPSELHVVWPDGCVSVSAMARGGRAGARMVGPRLRALRVPLAPGDRMFGIRFWPDAGGRALGVPARSLRDHVGLAEEFFGDAARRLGESVRACRTAEHAAALFDEWLAVVLASAPAVDGVVRAAVQVIGASKGSVAMPSLAGELGLSVRQLQRRFGDAVGITPKQFARIRRMRAALAKLMESPRDGWSAIAAELRYTDQAHLVRDIANLTGLTPTMLAERMGRISHVDVRP